MAHAAIAAACLAVLASVAGGGGRAEARSDVARSLRPPIVSRPIPFGPERRSETVAYATRHYGIRDWRLRRPRVIVEHYTVTRTFDAAFATFARDERDVEYGELPGVCAHFIVDRDGSVYQLVPLTTMCRHTVGLNWTAIGIEHVGSSEAEILRNPRQIAASERLSLWLMKRYGIELRNVIGHAESLASPYYRERIASFRCRTHADWSHASMLVYRRQVARLAARYGVATGPGERPYRPRC